MPNALNKSAGSEASLPVTLRIRRCAPQAALSNTYAVSRQMGATMQLVFQTKLVFSASFASAEATKEQWKRTKSAIALWKPSVHTPVS